MFKLNIECPHCKKTIEVDLSEYVVDSYTAEEKDMGASNEHTIDCPSAICPNCSYDMKITGSLWEYPEGVMETLDLEIK